MQSHAEHAEDGLGGVMLELSMCGPAAGTPNQTTPTTSVLAASTPTSPVWLSTTTGHAIPRHGFHPGSFLLGLTALLAALLSMARHPFLATLVTLGAMALLMSAAAGICQLSGEPVAVRNTREN